MATPSRSVSIETVSLGTCTTTLRSVRGGPIPILFLHGMTATSFCFERIMQKLPERFTAFAIDQRGHGDSESEDYDATTGMKTFAEDVNSLLVLLGIPQVHIVGWSLGGGVALQFAISYPHKVLSLTLEAPISPFGLHGTKDPIGTPNWPDFAGSGAGTFFPVFKPSNSKGEKTGDRPESSMLSIWYRSHFKPTFRIDREFGKKLMSEGLKAKMGPGFIPGSVLPSPNWPGYRPGLTGIMNAMSPAYCDLTGFSSISSRPPVLWLHGDSDITISDTTKGTPAVYGRTRQIPGWPGEEVFPDQPMLQQTRLMLQRYMERGGSYREVVVNDCGHSPHIEKETSFLEELVTFVTSAHRSIPPSNKL